MNLNEKDPIDIIPNDTEGIEFDSKGKIKITLSEEEIAQQKKDKYIKNETKKFKNLVKSGEKDEKVLKEQVIKRMALKDLEVHKLFDDPQEKKFAKDLAQKYLKEFIPKTISDKNNLNSVIYLEVLQHRLQRAMNELTAAGAAAIPLNLVDSIHKNLKEITINKEKLGLVGAEKEKGETDGFQIVQNLKEKFKVWMENNQGSRTLCCPACGEMVLLKIRMDKWIAQRHPFFKDRFLANKHLMRLYLQGKLSKEDIASILNSSPDYIEWLVEKLWMTDPDYRKEMRKIEGKHVKKLDLKLEEREAKLKKDRDELESGEIESGESIIEEPEEGDK